MSRPRKALWTILAVALAGAIGYRLSPQRQPPTPPLIKIAFVTGGSEAYWKATVNGAKAAAKRSNVELQIEMPSDDESLEQQNAILEKLGRTDRDGVALSPLDAAGQTQLINKIAMRTKVVTFDSDAQASLRLSHVGTGNSSAGAACARLVREAVPNGGKIAVLLANLTKENMVDRKSGFQERIAEFAEAAKDANGPKYVVVDYLLDNGSPDKCAQNIRDTLKKHPDLACFVGMNAQHGRVLVKVLSELGKLDQIKLVTFDVADETLAGVEAGHIYATLAQDPYQFGYEAVQTLAKICRGDETRVPIVGRGSLYFSAEPIKKEKVGEFRERMKKREAAPATASAEG
jgi:ribose transport system substrate-binding protein